MRIIEKTIQILEHKELRERFDQHYIRYAVKTKTLEKTIEEYQEEMEVVVGIQKSTTKVASKNSGISSSKYVLNNVELKMEKIIALKRRENIILIEEKTFERTLYIEKRELKALSPTEIMPNIMEDEKVKELLLSKEDEVE